MLSRGPQSGLDATGSRQVGANLGNHTRSNENLFNIKILAKPNGGDAGIRTLDRALQPYNGLANRRLEPLGHVSMRLGHMPDAFAHCKRVCGFSTYETTRNWLSSLFAWRSGARQGLKSRMRHRRPEGRPSNTTGYVRTAPGGGP